MTFPPCIYSGVETDACYNFTSVYSATYRLAKLNVDYHGSFSGLGCHKGNPKQTIFKSTSNSHLLLEAGLGFWNGAQNICMFSSEDTKVSDTVDSLELVEVFYAISLARNYCMEMKCHSRMKQWQVAPVKYLQLGLQGKCSVFEGDRQQVCLWRWKLVWGLPCQPLCFVLYKIFLYTWIEKINFCILGFIP